MNSSILIIGEDHIFLTTVLEQVRQLSLTTVEVVCNAEEATPIIQAQQPDLLILEAEQAGNLELCTFIKEQARIAWIYCILLKVAATEQPNSITLHHQSLERQIDVLNQGADAYIVLSLEKTEQHLHQQLLQAQIKVGLRLVQIHRETMRTNDLLSAIALLDPLTELNNRRALEWELPRQIQNARARSIPLSLVMLDVDFFKSINDTHGHLVGDRTLKQLSLRLRNNLRFYDTPFRYGGEEFVIILSNTDQSEAPSVAQRLCHLISHQPFTLDTSKGPLHLQITVSAGISTLNPQDDAKGTNILQRADQNLLKAKNQGRDQVVSDEITLPNRETSVAETEEFTDNTIPA